MKAYRICELKEGKLHSLFHGTKGSRYFPVGEWLVADKKTVHDGSCSTWYESGFHVLLSLEDTKDFLNKMFRIKKDRVIVSCEVEGLRPKSHSKHAVYLADKMKIIGVVE
jgi:hypothetical protein